MKVFSFILISSILLSLGFADESTSADFILEGHLEWQDTGVEVPSGAVLSISACGLICHQWENGECVGTWDSPDADVPSDGRGLDCPGLNTAGLVGKIGENGTCFFVGSSYSEIESETGTLFLVMNDANNWSSRGAWQVTIEVDAAIPVEGASWGAVKSRYE